MNRKIVSDVIVAQWLIGVVAAIGLLFVNPAIAAGVLGVSSVVLMIGGKLVK